jgi:hypothetical protein
VPDFKHIPTHIQAAKMDAHYDFEGASKFLEKFEKYCTYKIDYHGRRKCLTTIHGRAI